MDKSRNLRRQLAPGVNEPSWVEAAECSFDLGIAGELAAPGLRKPFEDASEVIRIDGFRLGVLRC